MQGCQVFVGHGNARSALALGQARGVALLALARAGITPATYSAQQVKKAAAGTGRADKAPLWDVNVEQDYHEDAGED